MKIKRNIFSTTSDEYHLLIRWYLLLEKGFPGDISGKKNPLATLGDARDGSLIFESGRSPGVEMTICSSILAWEIPCVEEPGGLQSIALQRVRHN